MTSPNARWNVPSRRPDTALRGAAGRRRGGSGVPPRKTRDDAADYQEFDPLVESDFVAGLVLETGLALGRRGEDDND